MDGVGDGVPELARLVGQLGLQGWDYLGQREEGIKVDEEFFLFLDWLVRMMTNMTNIEFEVQQHQHQHNEDTHSFVERLTPHGVVDLIGPDSINPSEYVLIGNVFYPRDIVLIRIILEYDPFYLVLSPAKPSFFQIL